MTIDNAALRQFILQSFSDEELETLCFDYFPEVQQNFTGGMTKNRKALLLIGYCETRGRLADLYGALVRERETGWNRAFGTAPVEKPSFSEETRFLGMRDPRQVFLSHATADATFAHRLAGDLRAEGWGVWIAPESIRPGEKWVEAISRGLETSGVFVVVLTPAAVGSRWVRTETNAALALEHRDLLCLLPLDVAACDVPLLWSGYQFTSFRRSYEAGLADLLGLLDGESAAPISTPDAKHVPDVETGRRPVSTPSDAKPAPRERHVKEEQWRQLQALAHEIAAALGRQSGDDELREVYRRFNRQFGLTTYKKLPRRRFAEGLAFLTGWRDEVMAAAPVETGRRPVSTPDAEPTPHVETGRRPVSPSPHNSSAETAEIAETAETGRRPVSTTSPDRRIHEKTSIELIRIPAGPFLYGSTDDDELAFKDQKPQRVVDLPEFWIGRTPITNAQFARFVAATDYRTSTQLRGGRWAQLGNEKGREVVGIDWQHPQGPGSSLAGKDDHPVTFISWYDAQAFCDWARLALPQQEQWEKAARGTDGRLWPWGNEPPTDERCNFDSHDTTPVGLFSPQGDSPYGCVDMIGNVWEWTASVLWRWPPIRYGLRGGAYYNDMAFVLNPAYRWDSEPEDGGQGYGFRVIERIADGDF